ncbi:hypothetical protein EDC96DRAFT_568912 [Choanephora cucurbitarum]|nr:hypothetical protein EDC96DRAFT_568912 [Choanephora cucurbitarum]
MFNPHTHQPSSFDVANEQQLPSFIKPESERPDFFSKPSTHLFSDESVECPKKKRSEDYTPFQHIPSSSSIPVIETSTYSDNEVLELALKAKKFDPKNPCLFGHRPPKPPTEESMKRHRPPDFDETVRKYFSGNSKKPKIFEDYLPQHNNNNNNNNSNSNNNNTNLLSLIAPPTNVKIPQQPPMFPENAFLHAPLVAQQPTAMDEDRYQTPYRSKGVLSVYDDSVSISGKKQYLFENTSNNKIDDDIPTVVSRRKEGTFAGFDRSKHLNDAFLSSESNAQIKPVDSRPEREINKNKVRIFGYDPDEANQVVQFFSSLGEMVEQPHCEANLTVLHYHSAEAAAKAIEYNGTVFNQNRVIGVTYNGLPKDVGLKVHDSGAEIYHFNSDEQKQNNSFFKKIKSIMFGN